MRLKTLLTFAALYSSVPSIIASPIAKDEAMKETKEVAPAAHDIKPITPPRPAEKPAVVVAKDVKSPEKPKGDAKPAEKPAEASKPPAEARPRVSKPVEKPAPVAKLAEKPATGPKPAEKAAAESKPAPIGEAKHPVEAKPAAEAKPASASKPAEEPKPAPGPSVIEELQPSILPLLTKLLTNLRILHQIQSTPITTLATTAEAAGNVVAVLKGKDDDLSEISNQLNTLWLTTMKDAKGTKVNIFRTELSGISVKADGIIKEIKAVLAPFTGCQVCRGLVDLGTQPAAAAPGPDNRQMDQQIQTAEQTLSKEASESFQPAKIPQPPPEEAKTPAVETDSKLAVEVDRGGHGDVFAAPAVNPKPVVAVPPKISTTSTTATSSTSTSTSTSILTTITSLSTSTSSVPSTTSTPVYVPAPKTSSTTSTTSSSTTPSAAPTHSKPAGVQPSQQQIVAPPLPVQQVQQNQAVSQPYQLSQAPNNVSPLPNPQSQGSQVGQLANSGLGASAYNLAGSAAAALAGSAGVPSPNIQYGPIAPVFANQNAQAGVGVAPIVNQPAMVANPAFAVNPIGNTNFQAPAGAGASPVSSQGIQPISPAAPLANQASQPVAPAAPVMNQGSVPNMSQAYPKAAATAPAQSQGAPSHTTTKNPAAATQPSPSKSSPSQPSSIPTPFTLQYGTESLSSALDRYVKHIVTSLSPLQLKLQTDAQSLNEYELANTKPSISAKPPTQEEAELTAAILGLKTRLKSAMADVDKLMENTLEGMYGLRAMKDDPTTEVKSKAAMEIFEDQKDAIWEEVGGVSKNVAGVVVGPTGTQVQKVVSSPVV